MALIIKGDMPTGKGCDGCEFQTSRCEQMDACTCYLFGGVIHNFHNERHKDCPIIGEIPDRHGRLINADKLADEYMRYLMVCFSSMQMSTANELVNAVKEAIKIAPTIVEATE